MNNRVYPVQKVQKPNAMSPLAAWLSYLENIHNRAIDMGLERIKQVADRMGVSQPAPYVFTVAGTNGKGTTCRTLEMILIAAGYRVGVYSSPHLVHYTERVRIQNAELAESDHVKALALIEEQRADISLTYFEFGTLSALQLFKQANLDVVILEVGLGGRLDATNLVDTDMAIVTSIAIDHTDWLGSDRESIGHEKAGIFRHNKPAVIGEPDAPHSIIQYAQDVGALLHLCQPNKQYDWSYTENANDWEFVSKNNIYHQLPMPNVPLANAATALAALSYSPLKVTEEAIRTGLTNATLAGRFQIIGHDPLLILDVAHNPHAANYLVNRLSKLDKKNGKIRVVLGMLSDKDISGTIDHLKRITDIWYCATLEGPRGTKASTLAQYLPEAKVFDHVADAWQQAMYDASKNDIVVVCGSFHTVSEVITAKVANV